MRPEDACNRQDWGGNQNPIWIGSKWFNGLGLPQFNFQKYKTEELTLMKYMRTNSQRTVVMPSSARPLPTFRTVFFRENFRASPSTVMMNFRPYAWHNNQSCQRHFVKLHHDRTMLKAPNKRFHIFESDHQYSQYSEKPQSSLSAKVFIEKQKAY